MPAMAYIKAKAGRGLVYYNAFIVRYGFVQTTLVAITPPLHSSIYLQLQLR
jgi:hypothetical protein